MAKYTFVDVSDDVHDMVVEAEFKSPYLSSKMQLVMREIANAVDVAMKQPILFEGLSAVHISEMQIEIRFRFSRKFYDLKALGENGGDALPRARTHFVIHVLARIDHVHTLGAVPFPADFRKFLELPAD